MVMVLVLVMRKELEMTRMLIKMMVKMMVRLEMVVAMTVVVASKSFDLVTSSLLTDRERWKAMR